MFFVSSKKLFSLSRYSNFCISALNFFCCHSERHLKCSISYTKSLTVMKIRTASSLQNPSVKYKSNTYKNLLFKIIITNEKTQMKLKENKP